METAENDKKTIGRVHSAVKLCVVAITLLFFGGKLVIGTIQHRTYRSTVVTFGWPLTYASVDSPYRMERVIFYLNLTSAYMREKGCSLAVAEDTIAAIEPEDRDELASRYGLAFPETPSACIFTQRSSVQAIWAYLVLDIAFAIVAAF